MKIRDILTEQMTDAEVRQEFNKLNDIRKNNTQIEYTDNDLAKALANHEYRSGRISFDDAVQGRTAADIRQQRQNQPQQRQQQQDQQKAQPKTEPNKDPKRKASTAPGFGSGMAGLDDIDQQTTRVADKIVKATGIAAFKQGFNKAKSHELYRKGK